ncbi:hypothetical protein HAX54_015110 [Datura stramonium]|uniref:Uncharacterized protein n=1 Tax=Datura stramonium TaxID=4076 RepID=A0ABS8TS60_DATST|nr:hypothetical protein [Datura stramonium]
MSRLCSNNLGEFLIAPLVSALQELGGGHQKNLVEAVLLKALKRTLLLLKRETRHWIKATNVRLSETAGFFLPRSYCSEPLRSYCCCEVLLQGRLTMVWEVIEGRGCRPRPLKIEGKVKQLEKLGIGCIYRLELDLNFHRIAGPLACWAALQCPSHDLHFVDFVLTVTPL